VEDAVLILIGSLVRQNRRVEKRQTNFEFTNLLRVSTFAYCAALEPR
jgi:hypothetical protein